MSLACELALSSVRLIKFAIFTEALSFFQISFNVCAISGCGFIFQTFERRERAFLWLSFPIKILDSDITAGIKSVFSLSANANDFSASLN